MEIAIVLLIIGVPVLLMAVYYLAVMYKPQQGEHNLRHKYSTEQNRFAAGKEEKASAARTANLVQLGSEYGKLTDFIENEYHVLMAEMKLKDAPLRYAMAKAREIADHRATIAEYENREAVARFATELNLPYERVHEIVAYVMKASIEMQQKLQMMNMRLSEHQQMKLIDLNTQIEAWKHKLQFGLEAKGGLTTHKKQQLVRQYLDDAYKLKQEIEQSELPEESKQQIAEYHDSVINEWRRQLGV